RPGDPQIDELDLPPVGLHPEEVGRLDVAVDDPRGVDRREAQRGLAHGLDDLALGGAPRLPKAPEVLAVEPLQGEVGPLVRVPPVASVADHVRAVEPGEEDGLSLEAGDHAGLAEVPVQPLDGDGGARLEIDATIDRAPRASGDERIEPEARAEAAEVVAHG